MVFGANLTGQEPWELRGANDAQLAALQARLATVEAALTLGAWNLYTPTWTSTGTQPAIGNGNLLGRYARIGRTVVANIFTSGGGTTTYGTGNYIWGLPVQAGVHMFAWQQIGTAKGFQAGNNLNGQCMVYGADSAKFVIRYSATAPAGAETLVGATTPWTQSTFYEWSMLVVYETAS